MRGRFNNVSPYTVEKVSVKEIFLFDILIIFLESNYRANNNSVTTTLVIIVGRGGGFQDVALSQTTVFGQK